jgi:predicted ribosome-associated RNA-binding protein Tma20
MIIRIRNSLTAGQVVDNILAGRSIEFAPEDSKLTLAACTTATGVNLGLRLTDEVVLDESTVPFTTSGDPILPDHIVVANQAVARGDHLILRAQNTTAGTLVLIALVEVTPL